MSKTSNAHEAVPFELTLHVRDHCLCLAAQRAARALARRFDEALRPVGLTSGQFSLLMSLNRPKPPSIGSVAALERLEVRRQRGAVHGEPRRGLPATTVDPVDRRGRLLTLTDVGRAVLAAASPIWTREHCEVERALADPDALRAGLSALG